ncbi:MAG: GAF domain-containing protein, partial [Chloroflexi bacterium]
RDNLEEIRILYNLRREKDQPRPVHQAQPAEQSIVFDRETMTIHELRELPPEADAVLSADSPAVQTIRDDQHAELLAPITLYGQPIGVLGIEAEPNVHWHRDDLHLVEEVSQQVALAIENATLLEQTRQRSQELSLLFNTSRQLSETVDLHEIYRIAANQMIDYLDGDDCRVLLLNHDRTHFVEVVGRTRNHQTGEVEDTPAPLTETVDDSPSLRQILQSPEVMVEHFSHPAMPNTVLYFPLQVRKNLTGVIRVTYEHEQRHYSASELQLARAIVSQTAVAVENAQLLERTEQALRETQHLYEISRALVESQDIDQVFQVVLDTVKSYGIDRVSISLLEREADGTEKVRIVANWDRDSSQILPVGSEISAKKFSLVKAFAQPPFTPLISEDLTRPDRQDPRLDDGFRRFMVEKLNAVTLFSAPMFVGTEYKGVLSITTRRPHVYSPTERRVYQTLADQVIIALERQRLLEETRQARDRAEHALAETELLYTATRELTSARHPSDLLATLVASFALPEPYGFSRSGPISGKITHMSLAVVKSVTEEGVPAELEFIATWNKPSPRKRKKPTTRELLKIDTPHWRVGLTDWPCLEKLSRVSITTFDSDDIACVKSISAKQNPLGRVERIAATPLLIGDQWLGVVFAGSDTPDFSLPEGVSHQIGTLTGQMAMVLQNLQLLEETQESLIYSEILSTLSQALIRVDTEEEIYQECLKAVAQTHPPRGAAIFMYDDIEGTVDFLLADIWNAPGKDWPDVAPGSRYSAEELGLVPMLKTGETVITPDVSTDERFTDHLRALLGLMRIRGMVAVPLWLKREVNGFILIASDEPAEFDPDAVRLYENIGRLVSAALENLRLLEEAEYRAQLLQTAAEVSQAATGELDLQTLLNRAVNLVRERFGFYHASIFLVDDYQKYAVVVASTGQVGKKMLEMGHKLAVGGKSIVGTATATAKPHIALDVGADAVHFNNPLLPNTRSEMALPLIARGKVIGALDVQSVKANAFSESDVTILQSMANQLANAIEAARAYAEAQKALDDIKRLQQSQLQEAWEEFVREQLPTYGYRLSGNQIVPLNE